MKRVIKSVSSDIAGTICDLGVNAPKLAMMKAFSQYNIPITKYQASIHMELRKYEHINSILEIPSVKGTFEVRNGRSVDKSDREVLYNNFHGIQKTILQDYCELFPGVANTIHLLKVSGISFGLTSGYSRDLIDIVLQELRKQDVDISFTVGSDEVKNCRPHGAQIYRCLDEFGTYSHENINIGDTEYDVEAGLNAGCWSVIVTDTGNMIQDESNDTKHEKSMGKEFVRDMFINGTNAHYIIDNFNGILSVIDHINDRMSRGEDPGCFRKQYVLFDDKKIVEKNNWFSRNQFLL